MRDREQRENILKDSGNAIVQAGAGAGKTTILTQKIYQDISLNKKHYKIAAITFTKKAAKDIENKLKGKARGNFIGTNDSFVEIEIIRPFISDAFGADYTDKFEVIYKDDKFSNFNEGLNLIKSRHRLGVYHNNKKNFKFQLALEILRRSKVARQYIQAKYIKLYIDEYQDCDRDMHNLFMYLKNELKLILFLVGDPKQCIYVWRGAAPEYFNGLISNDSSFSKYVLEENFRCSAGIQNYSNIFETEDLSKYQEIETVDDVIGVNGASNKFMEYLDYDREITILLRAANRNNVNIAAQLEQRLNNLGYDFIYIPRTPLDDLGTPNTSILIELMKFAKNEKYSVYDLINELPIEIENRSISYIHGLISPLKNEDIASEEAESILIQFFSFLEMPMSGTKDISTFIDVLGTKEFDNSYNGLEFKHKIMTIHASKGLEFDQVVIFCSNFINNIASEKNEHYVSTTRAKEKLVFVLNDSYLNSIKYMVKKCGLQSVDQIIKIV